MPCNWNENDYFPLLLRGADDEATAVLETLVDDIQDDKDATISAFLLHSESEDFLWALVRFLAAQNSRVAGNAAYVVGIMAESVLGYQRILDLRNSKCRYSSSVISNLANMMTLKDSESVMNAAGTLGTLAETSAGREWLLSEKCLNKIITHTTRLLMSDNLWTASNAALILARLTIEEEGCKILLEHSESCLTLTNLVQSLGSDMAGRGTNAAFAIGRLCGRECGQARLLYLPDTDTMILSFAKMLKCEDDGACKNACFAISCIVTNKEGQLRVLNSSQSKEIIKTLSQLLFMEDHETGWFSAMSLRILANLSQGRLQIRQQPSVEEALKTIQSTESLNAELRDEVTATLELLKRLDKPQPVVAEVLGADEVKLKWELVTSKSGLEVMYRVFQDHVCVYSGTETQCHVGSLQPCTQYKFKLQVCMEEDYSPFSDSVTVVTDEGVPTSPRNLEILGQTTSQLKIGWEAPELCNGVLKGYYIYQGQTLVETTMSTVAIVGGLLPGTRYKTQVCAVTAKGKGSPASIDGITSGSGLHCPSKPVVSVLGRNEVHVAWSPPEEPVGRINHYDLILNGRVVYSGMLLNYTVRRLIPDTEYTFVVCALTNEGRFESKATKKKTAKDEYENVRLLPYSNIFTKEGYAADSEFQRAVFSAKKHQSAPVIHKSHPNSAKSKVGNAFCQSSQSMTPSVKPGSANSGTKPFEDDNKKPCKSLKNLLLEKENVTKAVQPPQSSKMSCTNNVSKSFQKKLNCDQSSNNPVLLGRSVIPLQVIEMDAVHTGQPNDQNFSKKNVSRVTKMDKSKERLASAFKVVKLFAQKQVISELPQLTFSVSSFVRNGVDEVAEKQQWKAEDGGPDLNENSKKVPVASNYLIANHSEVPSTHVRHERTDKSGRCSTNRSKILTKKTTTPPALFRNTTMLNLSSAGIPALHTIKAGGVFFPMQIRTQPSNLQPHQLQRAQSTLLESGGIDDKLLQTIIGRRSRIDRLWSTPSGDSQPLQSKSNTAITILKPDQKQKSHKHLTGNLQNQRENTQLVRSSLVQRPEPDSLLLQQAWSHATRLEGARQWTC